MHPVHISVALFHLWYLEQHYVAPLKNQNRKETENWLKSCALTVSFTIKFT